MRRGSVTIGTLLLVGAATALVNCGGDDSTSPTGSGGSGGAGATGGSTGGSGGSGGSTGGASGAGGAGMQDSGADQSSGGSAGNAGASGAGGAAGKGGSSGAAGSAGAAGGKAGASGAGGSAGGGADSGKGGSAGTSTDASADANLCPAMQPMPASPCDIEADCPYGMTVCTCIDPGPNGTWMCHGGTHDGGGGSDAGRCPADDPTGEFCPDAGLPIGPCLYPGNTTCTCSVGDVEWYCIRFTPAH